MRSLSLCLACCLAVFAATAAVGEDASQLKVVRAFPNLKLNRPIVLTWDGAAKDQLYVADQLGKIFRMPNKSSVTEDDLSLVLDWEDHVSYKEKENEEGLLGLAFHPKFKDNGQFFLHYTIKGEPEHTNVIARFKVGKDGKADPASHEVLLSITHPFWNHKGGGLAFGPDGYLYISVGDGGKRDDPFGNGQNKDSLMGKILRIDVDKKDTGKPYAIPKDNPFANEKNAKGEIFAYGLRNVWGMNFDSKTGQLWAADVGQDVWEEIDIIVKGGNYGWNLREAMHKFTLAGGGSDPRKDLIEPIYEYHHDLGKSITGGFVYRGKKLPELVGWYLYADYLAPKVWALKYDEKTKTVSNRTLDYVGSGTFIAFGNDADGEAYITDAFGRVWTIAKE
jgi:quinoprotein glucose dehydrogenase